MNEHDLRFLACVLLEAHYDRLIERQIRACYEFYFATGLSLDSHPVAIDEAEARWAKAYEALIATSAPGDFTRGVFGVPGVYVGVN